MSTGNGVATTNIDPLSAVDELVGNSKDKGSGRITTDDFAKQLLGDGPLKDAVNAASEGVVQVDTWAKLATIPGSKVGQGGRVLGPDSGTHQDTVAGTAVSNEANYFWNGTAWIWAGREPIIRSSHATGVMVVDSIGFAGLVIMPNGPLLSSEAPQDQTSYRLEPIDGEEAGLRIRDEYGFVSLIIDQTGVRLETSDPALTFNEGVDAAPMIGGVITAFAGDHLTLNARNVLKQRSDLSRIRATFASEGSADGNRQAFVRTSDDEIVVEVDRCGSDVRFMTRLSEQENDQRNVAEMKMLVAQHNPASDKTVSVLAFGDSITNRQMMDRVSHYLNLRGYEPSFIGTMPGSKIGEAAAVGTGPLGEAREGWEFGDFTNAITDRVIIVPPGGEAAYLADDKVTKWPQNPFLRAATVSDDPSIVRNGYVFDMAFYAERFSLAAPDVVLIGIGTNDIRDRSTHTLKTHVEDGLRIICGQVRAAWPSTKILLWFPAVSRSRARDALWEEYVITLTAYLRHIHSSADANMFIIPTWALASQEAGFALSNVSPDPTGILKTRLSDATHLGPIGQQQIANILAAALALVAQKKL